MRILMVHGIAQGAFRPEDLIKIWTKTLQEGFEAARKPWSNAVNIDFPYYAKSLDDFVAQANLPTPRDVAQKGPGQNIQFEQFMQSALEDMQESGSISEQEIRTRMPSSVPQEKGIQNWGWVQAIARAID